jgi:hypothetical protein
MARRSGTSLIEALLVILLLAFVVPAGWTLLAGHRRAGARMVERAEALETVRTVDWILREEVDGSLEGRDWTALDGDSMSLRVFRGHALLDPAMPGQGTVLACYRGARAPSPEKDSVLLLGVDGQWQAHDLLSRTPLSTDCEDLVHGGSSERWTLSPNPDGAVLARVFETGSYHLADGALRYRRGEGGRQPLTPESMESGRFIGPGEGGNPLAWEIGLRFPAEGPPAISLPPASFWRGRVW